MKNLKINVLVLAAGQAAATDTPYPVFLTEQNGVTLLERIVQTTEGLASASYSFVMLEDDVRKFHLDNVVKRLDPDASLVRIARGTRGSACSALAAASTMDGDTALLVISANELVDMDLSEVVANFAARDLDAGALVFRSIHPRYSYVQLDDDGMVIQAAQQNPISNNATAGVFWFRRTGDFVDAAKDMIRKDAHVDGAYYICPAFNELLLAQKRVGVVPLDVARYHPVKTERQVNLFEGAALGVAA